MDFNSVKWAPDVTYSGTTPVKSADKEESTENKEAKIKKEAKALETLLKSKLVQAVSSESLHRIGVETLIQDRRTGKEYITLDPVEGQNGIKTYKTGIFKGDKIEQIRVYKVGFGGYMGDEVYEYDNEENLKSYTAATKDGYDEKSPIDMRKTNKISVTFNN